MGKIMSTNPYLVRGLHVGQLYQPDRPILTTIREGYILVRANNIVLGIHIIVYTSLAPVPLSPSEHTHTTYIFS
jgi:hypothetical protein